MCFRLQFRFPNRIRHGARCWWSTTPLYKLYTSILCCLDSCMSYNIQHTYPRTLYNWNFGSMLCRRRRRRRCRYRSCRRNWFCIANVLNGVVDVVASFKFQCTYNIVRSLCFVPMYEMGIPIVCAVFQYKIKLTGTCESQTSRFARIDMVLDGKTAVDEHLSQSMSVRSSI